MREIDPLREPSEALLSAALHRLATGSRRSAPEELVANLARSFRQHHARRRRTRIAGWSALAVCLVLAGVLGVKFAGRHGNFAIPSIAVQPQPAPAPAVAKEAKQPVAQRTKERSSVVATLKTNADGNQNDGFVPLPSYDPAMGTGELQVVRLELSGADLRLVGAPVAEDLSDQRVLADVVVGRDGTPYAVRFVQ